MKYLWSLLILIILVAPVWADEDDDDDDDRPNVEEWLEEQLEDQLDAQEDVEDRLEDELENRLEAAFDDDDDDDADADDLDDELEDRLETTLDHDAQAEALITRQLDNLEEQLEQSFDDLEPDHFIALLDAVEWQALQAQGVQALAVETLPTLGLHLVTLATLPAAMTSLPPAVDAVIVPDHYYRLDTVTEPVKSVPVAVGQTAMSALGWTQAKPALRRIGMMDSAIDTHNPCLQNVRVLQRAFHPAADHNDSLQETRHGTAIAGLMAGAVGCEAPGALHSAQLVNAVVFGRSPQGPVVASAGQLIQGLDWLLQQQVEIINMSLSGPANPLLERVLQQVQAHSVQVLASVGNDGAAAFPRYPAAYPSVIAITASDAHHQIYTRAGQGAHVEFTAPGVDLRVAVAEGATTMSGTSLATALATAMLASHAPTAATAERSQLALQAQDLGAPGRDPVFGFGLLRPAPPLSKKNRE